MTAARPIAPSHAVRDTIAERARHAVAVTFFVNGAVAGAWASIIPIVKDRLGLDERMLGLVLLTGMIGAVTGMLGGSVIATKIGTRPVMLRAGVAALLLLIPPLFAPTTVLFALATLVLFLTMGATDVAMNGHAALVEKRLARPVMSTFHGWWSLGGFAGAGAAAAAFTLLPPAAYPFLLALVGAGAMLAFVAPFLYPGAEDRAAEGGPLIGRPGPATLFLGLIALLALVSEGAALDWSAVWMRDALAVPTAFASSAYAVFALGMCIGRFSGDYARAALSTKALLTAASLLWTFGLGLAMATPSVAVALLGFFVFGLGNSVIFPVLLALAAERTRRTPAEAIAGVATLGYLGLMIGPPVIGFAAEAFTLTTTLFAVAALGLVAAALSRLA